MLGYTVMEIIETQAFDVLINTFFLDYTLVFYDHKTK